MYSKELEKIAQTIKQSKPIKIDFETFENLYNKAFYRYVKYNMTDKFFVTTKGQIFTIMEKSTNLQTFVKEIGKNKYLGNMVKLLGTDVASGYLVLTDKPNEFILEI